MTAAGDVTMVATGELMLLMEDDPATYFDSVRPVLAEADLVTGHLENLHTNRPAPAWDPMHPAPDPAKLEALAGANYSLITLAGNPAYCYGPPGIADTIDYLRSHGIETVGAGMDIAEAIRPVIIERNGTKVGFLNYDTVGTRENGASPTKPGVAYVDVITHYEVARLTGMAPQVFTWPEPWSLQAMRENVEELRGQCDVLVVALHMGIGGREVELADYEWPLCTAAIDAGADVILGTHCHMLKGIQFYRGKPIFHCIGNMVASWPDVEGDPIDLSEIAPMAETMSHSRYRSGLDGGLGKYFRKGMFGGPRAYDPTSYRNNTALFKLGISAGQVTRISFVPCLFNEKGYPVVVGKSPEGQQVFDYMTRCIREPGLNAELEWDGDEVVVTERAK